MTCQLLPNPSRSGDGRWERERRLWAEEQVCGLATAPCAGSWVHSGCLSGAAASPKSACFALHGLRTGISSRLHAGQRSVCCSSATFWESEQAMPFLSGNV